MSGMNNKIPKELSAVRERLMKLDKLLLQLYGKRSTYGLNSEFYDRRRKPWNQYSVDISQIEEISLPIYRKICRDITNRTEWPKILELDENILVNSMERIGIGSTIGEIKYRNNLPIVDKGFEKAKMRILKSYVKQHIPPEHKQKLHKNVEFIMKLYMDKTKELEHRKIEDMKYFEELSKQAIINNRGFCS